MAAFTFKKSEAQKDVEEQQAEVRSEIATNLDQQLEATGLLREDIDEFIAVTTKVGEQVMQEPNQTGDLSAAQKQEAKKVTNHMASICHNKSDFQQIIQACQASLQKGMDVLKKVVGHFTSKFSGQQNNTLATEIANNAKSGGKIDMDALSKIDIEKVRQINSQGQSQGRG